MNLPLQGLKVLDFSQVVFGPVCTQMLGDLGADVTKVEPLEGDMVRLSKSGTDSAMFLALNRSKRSIAVNLKDGRGLEIALRLAEKADVVVENFRPGVMKSLGLDYEDIAKINPRVIYASLSMYGEEGPLARRRGGDIWAQAFTGVIASQGSPDGPPYLAGHAFLDLGGGLIAINAIMIALFMRERTGKGQKVTTNQVASGVFMQTTTLCYTLIDGVLLKKGGRGTARGQFPYGAYTARDGDVATLFGQDDDEWRVVCSILGIEYLLEDSRYDTQQKRTDRKFELYPILDEAFKKKTREEWEDLFRKRGLRCDPCLDYNELLAHPQFKANDLLVEVDHAVRGKINTLGPPMKFKALPPIKPQRPPPILGEHTVEILSELGYKRSEIEEFVNKGVIGIATPDMLQPEKTLKKGPPITVGLGKGARQAGLRGR